MPVDCAHDISYVALDILERYIKPGVIQNLRDRVLQACFFRVIGLVDGFICQDIFFGYR